MKVGLALDSNNALSPWLTLYRFDVLDVSKRALMQAQPSVIGERFVRLSNQTTSLKHNWFLYLLFSVLKWEQYGSRELITYDRYTPKKNKFTKSARLRYWFYEIWLDKFFGLLEADRNLNWIFLRSHTLSSVDFKF